MQALSYHQNVNLNVPMSCRRCDSRENPERGLWIAGEYHKQGGEYKKTTYSGTEDTDEGISSWAAVQPNKQLWSPEQAHLGVGWGLSRLKRERQLPFVPKFYDSFFFSQYSFIYLFLIFIK